MKFLIFTLLLSCGKKNHDFLFTNLKEDTHIKKETNILENSNKKFNLEIEGTLSLQSQKIPSQRIDISFSNFPDIKDIGLRMLTSSHENLKSIQKEALSRNLFFKKKEKYLMQIQEGHYESTFFFKTNNQLKIILHSDFDKKEFILQDKNYLNLRLDSKTIISLLSGTTTIEILPLDHLNYDEWSQLLQKNYSPVLIFGNKFKDIIYLDKKISLSEFKENMGIDYVLSIDDVDLYDPKIDIEKDFWFTRNFDGNFSIFFKSNLKTISDYYKKSLQQKTVQLKREKGNLSGLLRINKKPSFNFYLRISGEKTLYEFNFLKELKLDYQNATLLTCEKKIPISTREITKPIILSDIFENLLIDSNLGKIDPKLAFYFGEEDSNDGGPIWILGFNIPAEDISISLVNRPIINYSYKPIHRKICKKAKQNHFKVLNSEKLIDLSVTTFVENI